MKTKLLREIENYIKVPKEIHIGDPLYLDTSDSKKLCYQRQYGGLFRVINEAQITTRELLISDKLGEVNMKTQSIAFAPNKATLKRYRDRDFGENKELKRVIIGTDTAEYSIETKQGFLRMPMMSDGFMGEAFEIYDNGVIEGVYIELVSPDHREVEDLHAGLKSLFTRIVTVRP